jgi:D-3-phosphoglycerate dehydrogenase
MSLTVVIADTLPPVAVEAITRHGWHAVVTAGQPPDALHAALGTADALVVRSATKVTADLIARAPRLRVIARAGTGVDTIDVPAATARGIVVMNSPGANAVSVAELTMGLMLSLVRRLPAADASMKAAEWQKSRFSGWELRGRTLGLVGFGKIGQEVARRARAFEMTVVAHDPYISGDVARDLGVTLVDLDDVMARADVLSLHAPRSAETRHLIDRERLAKCRPGLFLINTARGELVDSAALLEALESGRVRGAALDVHEVEPPTDHALPSHPNVIATPHIAASTEEGQERASLEAVGAMCEFLLSGRIRNAVNAPAVPPELHERLAPFIDVAARLGRFAGRMAGAPMVGVGVRTYGALTGLPAAPLTDAALTGVFDAIGVSHVTVINARGTAADRGVEVVESQSSRAHRYGDAISLKLHTTAGECWLEGTSIAAGQPRLLRVGDVLLDAPLSGTILLVENDDQPGVVGAVGTLLGSRGVNIATFNLGRSGGAAVGIVTVESASLEDESARSAIADALSALPGVRRVRWIDVEGRRAPGTNSADEWMERMSE